MIRMSQHFTQTRREAPADVDRPGLQFLIRAGYLQPLMGGTTGLLPLGLRVCERVENRLRDALEAYRPQEIVLPLAQPGELWGPAGLPADRFDSPHRQNVILAPHSLPALMELLRTQLRSYRQLPALLLQSGSRWQNGPRPRGGVWRGRETRTLEVFNLCQDEPVFKEREAYIQAALERCLAEMDLPIRRILTSACLEGGARHSAAGWHCALPGGETTALVCPACGYAADETAARFRRDAAGTESPLPLEKVATPHCPTIESLAEFLGITAARTAKAVFLTADAGTRAERLIFAVVRGDREVNPIALMEVTGARTLHPAEDAEIEAVGAVPGYASPVGLKDVEVVVDTEIPASPNLVSGANEAGFHLRNVNYGRDYAARTVAEIAAARPGLPCPHCGSALRAEEGVVIASSVAVDRDLLAAQNCTFMGSNGKPAPVEAGITCLNLSHLMACLAELHRDNFGLCWPPAAAPLPVHLVILNSKSGEAEAAAEELATRLAASGLEVLVDDRNERAGVKFNDADLIGLPLRVTASERALQEGGFEFKPRGEKDKIILSLEEVLERAAVRLNPLREE